MDPRARILRFVLYVALYVAGAMVATWFVDRPDQVALIWPSAGLGVAVLLLHGVRWWPFIAVAVVIIHLTVSIVPLSFVGFSLAANTLSAIVGVAIVRWRFPTATVVMSMRTGFDLLQAALVAVTISALIGATGLVVSGMVPAAGFGEAAIKWALANLFGMITVGTTVLVLAQRSAWQQEPLIAGRAGPRERIAWLLSLVVAAALFISLGGTGGAYALGLSVLPLTVLLWGAARLEPLYSFAGTMVLVLVTTMVIGLGIGGYQTPSSLADVAILIVFMSLVAMIPQMVAAMTHENRIAAAKLVRRATTDELTSLPNRVAFQQRVVAMMRAHPGESMTLVYVDVDDFKVVNDTASHAVGDELIRALASALRTVVEPGEVLARLGGDEFGILWLGHEPGEVARRTQAVLDVIANFRHGFEDHVIAPTASLGVVGFHADTADFASLLARADAACYTAKELGGNRAQLAELGAGAVEAQTTSMRWVSRLARAFDEDHFVLYAQSVVPLHATLEHRRGLEVLVRLRDPATGEILPPAAFVHAAERFKLGVKLDRYVLDRTLAWFDANPDALTRVDSVGINLTAATVESDSFAAFVEERIARSALPPQRLCFELTETSAVRDLSRAQEFIRRVRALGCRFALDDFGTGFCSFSYLKSLDVDYFKIDGSFVRDLESSALALAVLRSIASIARVLDKRTVAEWVETPALLQRVTELGIDYAQGYAIDRPMPLEQWFSREDGLVARIAG